MLLTYGGLNKMANIAETFQNTFTWMKDLV